MTVIELLNPPECDTEKGRGWAHWLIDYGPHGNVLFGVVMHETGQLWWVPTHKLTIASNWSLGQHGTKKVSQQTCIDPGFAVPPEPIGPAEVLRQPDPRIRERLRRERESGPS